jgi:hypothetical protein
LLGCYCLEEVVGEITADSRRGHAQGVKRRREQIK